MSAHPTSPGYSQWSERTIRFQFRRNGLVHLTKVHDYMFVNDNTCRVTHPYVTLCGKSIPMGTGGWGYNAKDCPECHRKAI